MVRLSLRYGNNALSCFAYGSYGVITCGVLGSMRRGARYGRLALDLLEKLNAKEWKAQIRIPPYCLTFHWTEHVRNSLRPLQESFQIGLETGQIDSACISTNVYCIHSFLCGRPLGRVEEEARAYSALYRQYKQETNYNYNEVYRQSMLNFMGRSEDPVRLVGDTFDEDRMIAQNRERGDKTGGATGEPHPAAHDQHPAFSPAFGPPVTLLLLERPRGHTLIVPEQGSDVADVSGPACRPCPSRAATNRCRASSPYGSSGRRTR